MADHKAGAFRADRMRELRQRDGLSRADLALLARVSPETVRSAENGRCHPSARVVRALAEALTVPVAELSPTQGRPTLKELRKNIGRTQRQLAEVIGMSAGMVSKVEAGMYGVSDPDRWAAGYRVSRDEWAAAWEAGREKRRRAVKPSRGPST